MDPSGIVLINVSSSQEDSSGDDNGSVASSSNNNNNNNKSSSTSMTSNSGNSRFSRLNSRQQRNILSNNIVSPTSSSTPSSSSWSSSCSFRKCWTGFIAVAFMGGMFIVGNNFNMVLLSSSSNNDSLLRFGPSSNTQVESKKQDEHDDESGGMVSSVGMTPWWNMPQNTSTLSNAAHDPKKTTTTTYRTAAGYGTKPGNLFRRYKQFREASGGTGGVRGDNMEEEEQDEREAEEIEELWQFQQQVQGRYNLNKRSAKNNKNNKKKRTTRKDRNQQVLQQQLEQQQEALKKLSQQRQYKANDQAMPVIIPSYYSIFSRAVQPLHASDALMCRKSVVNFVINATDGKDECFGLKKAFDKTCGSEQKQEKNSNAAAAESESSAAAETTTEESTRRHRRKTRQHRRSRRKLAEKLEFQTQQWPWRLHWYQSVRFVHESLQFIYHVGHVPNAYDKDFFFAEDEILGDAWQSAQYQVQNNLDLLVHADLVTQWQAERVRERERKSQQRHRQRRLQEETAQLQGAGADNDDLAFPPKEELATSTEEEEADVDNNTTITTATKEPEVPPPPPPINLELPTLNKHASETVVQEALILQQGDKIIAKAANQSKAAQEAAASSKALSDTTAAVSALLNDPSSVEARTCCASILNVYHDNCSRDEEEQISDSRLFFVVVVMALCGMVKSLIRHYRILWLPEAAGCILVGVFSGYLLLLSPRHQELSFDGNWFLRIMVPPIIFEAALSIDKKSFNRHIVPILFYAVCGTLMATLLTALVVFYASHMLSDWCTPIPFIEAMTFGALISSIDPIAVLSVLSNMGMTDKDTIYVVIFGESLLNDGIAIVLFETLVHFLDENLIIDSEAISLAAVHFSVVAIGSLLIGVASGMLSTVYFWVFHGCQTPMVEVLMFFCWALLPYYVCDGIGWSGIVAAVAVGFVMDVAIVGQKSDELLNDTSEGSDKSFSTPGKRSDIRERRRILDSPDGHLSAEARTHIHFVAEIVATVMETAIFAYLGLFLFSHRYHWNFWHTVVAILACCLSRAIMIPTLSCLANRVTRILQRSRGVCTTQHQHAQRKLTASLSGHSYPPAAPGVVIDRKMQIVLWFSGLRGAMSFALVEHIPLYDSVSGEGTPLKPELKAMTSATILFTVFVLGGYTNYVMDRLGLAPAKQSNTSETELISLLSKSGSSTNREESFDDDAAPHHIMKSSPAPTAASSVATSMTTTTLSPSKRAGATALPGNRRRQRAIVTENGN